jgi:two-component system chemotaxis sensor kinase CheA
MSIEGGEMSDEFDEIWTLYADDGAQSLDIVEEALLHLKEAPGDADTIAALFRAVHTFKGNARVLGLAVIESRAHIAEDMIGLVRDEGVPVDPGMLALLLETADALRGMLDQSLANRSDVEPGSTDDLVKRMGDKIEDCRRIQAGGAAVAGGGAVIFEPAPKNSLANDPMYREIFSGMVHDVMGEMCQALASFDAAPHASRSILGTEVERLRYAAEQIGMPEWPDLLAQFLELPQPGAREAEALLARMERLCERHFQAASSAMTDTDCRAQVHAFFDGLEPLLDAVSKFGARVADGEAVDPAAIGEVVDAIKALAEPLGFVRVLDVASQLAGETNALEFRRLELQFYEELASIELAMPEEIKGAKVQPSAVLQGWCADQVFENLLDLTNVLDRIRKNDDPVGQCSRVSQLMRQIYHACHHYGMETAAHLTMSLVDLFARVQTSGMPPDPVLLHIARSVATTMELVFDSAGSGHVPDMAAIEKLFEEAKGVTFVASGTASSSSIEARLGLPKSFHKVLTPESVKTAVTAMDKGHRFYIVRADLNLDEEVAGKFLDWINSGIAAVVSNVTVFERDVTLFDFLLATPLAEGQLAEAMAGLDPSQNALRVEMVLTDRRKRGETSQAETTAATEAEDQFARTAVAQEMMSGDMLEAIGEIVTGQAMVHHMLAGLAESDLARAVDAEVNRAGGDWSKAQRAVRRLVEDFTDRLEVVLQSEAQLNTQLGRLQEEAIAVRTRSATLLLKPLEAFAEATARQYGRQVAMSSAGEDLMLDYTMLEDLKAPLRNLVAQSVLRSIELPEHRVAAGKDVRGMIHVGLTRRDDHIAITVDDDGCGGQPGSECDEIASVLRSHGGDLRVAASPAGGFGFNVTMPLAMVVLDGMVVRVGQVRYVVPLDAIQRIVNAVAGQVMRVSADRGRYMLKLGPEDVLPIQFLKASGIVDDDDPFAAVGEDAKQLFVVVGKLAQRIALSVDELVGQQLVLIRPLQGYLSNIRGVTGCALLGSGEVGMVLDMGYVLNSVGL